MATTKLYYEEKVEFQNGHTTTARPLPIRKLKLLQSVFEDYGKDTRKVAVIIKEVNDTITEMQERGESIEDFVEKKNQEVEDGQFMSYEDCLVSAALIALNHWGVINEKNKNIGEVTEEYVEEELDVPTLTRICEIAGNFKTGQLDMSQPEDFEEKKAKEV